MACWSCNHSGIFFLFFWRLGIFSIFPPRYVLSLFVSSCCIFFPGPLLLSAEILSGMHKQCSVCWHTSPGSANCGSELPRVDSESIKLLVKLLKKKKHKNHSDSFPFALKIQLPEVTRSPTPLICPKERNQLLMTHSAGREWAQTKRKGRKMDELHYSENAFRVINLMLHFFIWLTSQSNSPRLNWLMRRAAGVMRTLEKE